MAQLTKPFILLLVAMLSMLVMGVRQGDESAAQIIDADLPQITAYKRFYRWEDSKRAMEDEDSMRAKRKQFYAWAGKRSAPIDETGGEMQKRKQFYAWAGK